VLLCSPSVYPIPVLCPFCYSVTAYGCDPTPWESSLCDVCNTPLLLTMLVCNHVGCVAMFARVFQVLFLKDINLPRPDKYDTCALIAFLQQLVTFKGFYDEHLEFLGIERVHIVCTMNPATTVGRHPLSTRWVHVCVEGGLP
jgi:hypothetical protein